MQTETRSSSSLSSMDIHFNPDGWGPIAGGRLPIFEGVPYANFDKKDRQVRPADFVSTNTAAPHQKFRRVETDFTYRHDAAEENTFQLVDTTKNLKAKRGPKSATARNKINANRTNAVRPGFDNKTKGGARGKFGVRKRMDRRQDRNPSLTVEADWEQKHEFDLSQLLKLQTNLPATSDLCMAGYLDQYDEAYERVTTRNPSRLRRFEDRAFYYVTSKEDPILERYAIEEKGNVFATDAILAQLMASPRSVYSWDIVAQKIGGIIFLDKRDDSDFDMLTVSETAQEPPSSSDDVDEFNRPDKLSLEATTINQNFSQQILLDASSDEARRRSSAEPNPFYDESQGASVLPASVAYSYRQFTLGDIKIVARCELHGWIDKRETQPTFTAYALNEWDSRFSGGINWRQKIDTTKGAVLGTEIKNNNCKIAKWTAQSIMADAGLMKLGYVSRVAPGNYQDHQILAMQSHRPKELAGQLGMSLFNIWGIVKMFCETLMKEEDGKYLIMKDPNKPAVRIYSIPVETFEDDFGDDEDEEEEEGAGSGEENGDEEEEEETAEA